jgi:hypothetical protein
MLKINRSCPEQQGYVKEVMYKINQVHNEGIESKESKSYLDD